MPKTLKQKPTTKPQKTQRRRKLNYAGDKSFMPSMPSMFKVSEVSKSEKAFLNELQKKNIALTSELGNKIKSLNDQMKHIQMVSKKMVETQNLLQKIHPYDQNTKEQNSH